MISGKTRRIVGGGLFIALAVALGYMLAQFPNIELVTATVFLAGYFLGWKMGVVVGGIGMFIYSTFNPYGMATPPVLAMQVLSMSLSGAAGGICAHQFSRSKTVHLALAGFFLTLTFDFLTTLGQVIIIELTVRGIVDMAHAFGVAIATGAIFYFTHIVSNTIIFSTLVPVFIKNIPVALFRFENV